MNTKQPMTPEETETRNLFMSRFVTKLGMSFPDDADARRATTGMWNRMWEGLLNEDPRTPREYADLVLRCSGEVEQAARTARANACFLAQDWIKEAKHGQRPS